MKKLVAKVGSYTDREGQSKSRWVTIGVIMSNDNGEYALLDPAVSLAGILGKQNAMSDKPRDKVMVSIFTDDRQGGGSRPALAQTQAPAPAGNLDDEIPF